VSSRSSRSSGAIRWLRRGESYTQLIEPVAMFVASPKGENPRDHLERGHLAFDFSDADLFVPKSLRGLDRATAATVSITGYAHRSTIPGGTRRARSHAHRPELSRAEQRRLRRRLRARGQALDIVGRFVISPNEAVDAVYRYRLRRTT